MLCQRLFSGCVGARGSGRDRGSKTSPPPALSCVTVLAPCTPLLLLSPWLCREEETKIKNFNRVLFGKWDIEVWYYSPFSGMPLTPWSRVPLEAGPF